LKGKVKMKMIKLFADVRDGNSVFQSEPFIEGATWTEVQDSRQTAGSYYQSILITYIPADHPILDDLPDNCWVEYS
jgi:hypothetical protein